MSSKNNKKPLVISIDGPDGSGKTTQLELLQDYLKKQKLTVYATRASGGTPIAAELRKVVSSDLERSGEVELYIFFAMFSSLAEDLNKRRITFDVILIDRSPLSILAYDAYAVHLDDLSEAYQACEKYFRQFYIDILFYLDTNQETLNERLKNRQKTADYYEKQGSQYFKDVREGFRLGLTHMKQNKTKKFDVYELDAAESIEMISKKIENIVNNKI